MLQRLKNISSFTYLNITQFLGALNDNLFKLLIVYFCIDIMGVEHSTLILSIAGAFFVVPFLLFSSTSGMIADRFSKRNIIVVCKVMELVIMALGVIALTLKSPWGAYSILFLMATQSALFGPSKYGIIPELVESDKLSKANGILGSMTYLAIIIGTFLASFLTHITHRNFVVGGVICTFISLIGLLVSLLIDKTPASGSNKKIHPWFMLEIYKTSRLIAQKPVLLISMIGSAYFLFGAAYIQLNIIPYSMEVLGLTDVQGGYLFLLTAVGIGIGSMMAGKISGRSIELGLVPLGGIGMAIGSIGMDLFSNHPWAIIVLIPCMGIAGGIYLVPLDSYIQFASPNRHRGQIAATTNFFGFFGVLLSSAALFFISDVLGLSADKGFAIFGVFTAIMVVVAIWAIYHHFTRYLGMLLAKLHYRMTITGNESIPHDKPSIFVCHHTAWNDTLLLLGSQRTPVRFFTEKVLDHSPFVKWLYSLLKIVSIPSIELIEDSAERMKQIRSSLRRGVSICLFVDPSIDAASMKRVLEQLHQLREGTPYKVVNVELHKGEKLARTDRFRQLIEKIRVPATIEFSIA